MEQTRRPTRRQFLAEGAGGLAGVAWLSAGVSSCRREVSAPRMGRSTVRTLGRTGLRLPVVSMGSSNVPSLVPAALDAGIVYVHTSSSYSEQNHERMLGQVLRTRSRGSFVVGTTSDLPYRFSGSEGLSLDLGTGTDPARIGASLQGSLERLGLDAVDIYYLASVGERRTALHEPYMRAFEALKRQGQARFVGLTTHSHEPDVIRAAVESRFWDVVLTAYNFRQSHREDVRAAIGEAASAGVGIVAMKTQAGVYWDSRRQRKINMRAALKWVLQDEHVTTAIPAFSNHDEMREDLAVMEDLAFTPAEARDLGLGSQAGLSGLYCQQCDRCVPQCPAAVDIPRLMRAHMYATGYDDVARARRLLTGWNAAGIDCVDCSRCLVRCALGHDVRAAAMEMTDLLAAPGTTTSMP